MGLSIKFMQCNSHCVNCYENKIREQISPHYDINRVVENLQREIGNHDAVTIHGGEPLLINVNHLERLLDIIYRAKGQTGIQTNLLALNEYHIELFKKYRTHVGISLDGIDAESNVSRGYNPEPVFVNIDRLHEQHIQMSTIIVLWRTNARDIPDLVETLIDYGISDFRVNPGIPFCDPEMEIDNADLFGVWKLLFDRYLRVTINPVRDIIDLLMGHKNGTCNFSGCDPYRTTAEVTLYEDGTFGNCLKSGSALDGFRSCRADERSQSRQEMLHQISIEHGGCGGCRFWPICQGGCPGEAEEFDWRNKTRFCKAWRDIFSYIESKIKALFPNAALTSDAGGLSSADILSSLKSSTWQQQFRINPLNIKPAPQQGHGDCPHGDSHGDHTDGIN